jgi:para-aminobenzoate synthetase component 1
MTVWHWQRRSLPEHISGAQVWEVLFGHEAIAVLLESPKNASPTNAKTARYSIAAGSPRKSYTPELGNILACLKELQVNALKEYEAEPESLSADILGLPFIGGYLGWLGYDLAWEIEKLPYLRPDSLPFPIAFWYEPQQFAIVDNWQNQVWLAAGSEKELGIMCDRIENLIQGDQEGSDRLSLPTQYKLSLNDYDLKIDFLSDADQYEAMVQKAKAHIKAGDIFQANLSLRFGINWRGDGWQLYKRLQQINPSPFASYWRTPWGEMISVSPERLVKLAGRQAETRPIAGTRPRGTDPEADLAYEQELLSSTKERAEHIMLVDLERNDLGRVCEWGSVKVDELLVVERYSHVMHLVSNVVGNLSSDRDGIDLIRATFPGGTITGCPKVRCMEIIEALEPCRRSLFYGSCGYLDRRGNLDLNILIRTLLKCGDRIWGQVGAGIVADSLPDREWLESLQKAKAQLAALDLTI